VLHLLQFSKRILQLNVVGELLLIEERLVVELLVYDVAVALVAPEREIGKTEDDRVIRVLLSVFLDHVALNVAGAGNSSALWLETDPVLTDEPTLEAWVVHLLQFEVLEGPNVVIINVGAVRLWLYSVKSLVFHSIKLF